MYKLKYVFRIKGNELCIMLDLGDFSYEEQKKESEV